MTGVKKRTMFAKPKIRVRMRRKAWRPLIMGVKSFNSSKKKKKEMGAEEEFYNDFHRTGGGGERQ